MRCQRCDRGLLPFEEPATVDCGACGGVVADPLGGPPVLSPLEERVAALEAKVAWLCLRWIGS
jgi:ribosomal protein S27E